MRVQYVLGSMYVTMESSRHWCLDGVHPGPGKDFLRDDVVSLRLLHETFGKDEFAEPVEVSLKETDGPELVYVNATKNLFQQDGQTIRPPGQWNSSADRQIEFGDLEKRKVIVVSSCFVVTKVRPRLGGLDVLVCCLPPVLEVPDLDVVRDPVFRHLSKDVLCLFEKEFGVLANH